MPYRICEPNRLRTALDMDFTMIVVVEMSQSS